MGFDAQFLPATPDWDQATDLLDHNFPLSEGSHKDVTAYLVYFDHLLAIQANGTSCGLRKPCQFVEAHGSHHNPIAVVLQHSGLTVEIDNPNRPGGDKARTPTHPPRTLEMTTLVPAE